MIDVHTHFLDPGLTAPDSTAERAGWPVCTRVGDTVEVRQAGRLVRVLGPEAWDREARIAAMDALGVDVQVVSPTPFTFLYDADPRITQAYCRAQNTALAELVTGSHGRLIALGSVPLQVPRLAVEELDRAMDLGLHGVEIGTHAAVRQLHDPELRPFFARAEERSASLFVHPWSPAVPERSCHHGLAFGLGRSMEMQLGLSSLIFGGPLEEHPQLRVCVAHGGGGIAALRGRLHNGWSRQDADSRTPQTDPAELLRRVWADGLVYDARVLALTVETFGVNRLVVGSDFPFAAMEPVVGASFAEAARSGLLSMGHSWKEATRANALDFLNLPSVAP